MVLTQKQTLERTKEKEYFQENYQKQKLPLSALIEHIKLLYESGGPMEFDYEPLNDILNYYRGVIDEANWKLASQQVADLFGDDFLNSIAGHAFLKPYGYAGDFSIIDKMYLQTISNNPKLEKWDKFYHQHAAAKAVRNRKTFFKKVLAEKVSTVNSTYEILNVASGPCRDLLESFQENYLKMVQVDCVEADLKAILHATSLNAKYLPQITFYNQNIFRFKTEKKYDLIWSAGLFDYFDDKTFVRLVSRLIKNIKPGGELIIGNFAVGNPTEGYMELFLDWYLYHRSEEQLIRLAQEAGVSDKRQIRVDQEAEGVNLFMRIQF